MTENNSDWQTYFSAMLPEIESRLRTAFRQLDPASREEAIAEGVAHTILACVRLQERSLLGIASPSTLVWYSARQVKRGRPATGRINSKEPLSRYAQLTNAIKVERLPHTWLAAIVADKRAPIADQVAAKLDVAAWLATLSRRRQEVAKDLAVGCSTSEVAKKYGVTPGRISQLRRTLEKSWAAFQHPMAPGVTQ
jgi:hypothetical protein